MSTPSRYPAVLVIGRAGGLAGCSASSCMLTRRSRGGALYRGSYLSFQEWTFQEVVGGGLPGFPGIDLYRFLPGYGFAEIPADLPFDQELPALPLFWSSGVALK